MTSKEFADAYGHDMAAAYIRQRIPAPPPDVIVVSITKLQDVRLTVKIERNDPFPIVLAEHVQLKPDIGDEKADVRDEKADVKAEKADAKPDVKKPVKLTKLQKKILAVCSRGKPTKAERIAAKIGKKKCHGSFRGLLTRMVVELKVLRQEEGVDGYFLA